MISTRKEVEFLIKTNLGGSRRDMAGLSKDIAKIGGAITEQTAAAKRGENVIDELKGSVAALADAQSDLLGKASLVDSFNKSAAAIQKQDERVTKLASSYEKYSKKLAESESVSEKEQNTLVKKGKSLDAARNRLAQLQAIQQKNTEELKQSGVAMDDLATASDRLRNVAAQLGTVIRTGQEGIRGYAADVRKARDADQLLADAERALHVEWEKSQAASRAAGAAAAEAAKRIASAADRDTQLNLIGIQAQQSVRGLTTLARAATDLRPKLVSLRDAVGLIQNPASGNGNLGEIEKNLDNLAAKIKSVRGPVKDYEADIKALAAAGKQINSQAGLIDSFRQQGQQLRTLRSDFVGARSEVTRLAGEVRKGGEDNARYVTALGQAEAKLRTTSQALRQAIITQRENRDTLATAGIATNDLTGAENRLTEAARKTTGAVLSLNGAIEKNGIAKRAAGTGLFEDGGRTTLSIIQRLRGELLALAATYTGLQGSISLAGGAISAFNTREGSKAQLGISLKGDRAAIDAEYQYVREQSDRIGIEFERAIQQYAKFATAAALGGRDRKEIKFIFETFAEVGRVAGLSAENLDGVFKALEQVFSKGTIAAEELRGQLGDRLFGAFQVAAQALKKEFPNLEKAMKNGEVTADQLVKIAAKYKEIVGQQLPGAQKSLASEQARVNSAFFDFKNIIADKGFADEFKKLLAELNQFLKGPEGAALAESLGRKFAIISQLLAFMLKNLDTLIIAASAFFAIWVTGRINSMILSLQAIGAAALGTAAAMTTLQKSIVLLQVLIASLAFGTFLYDQFEGVRNFGIGLVAGFDAIFTSIAASAKTLFEILPDVISNAFVGMLKAAVNIGGKVITFMARIVKAMGMEDAANKMLDAVAAGAAAVSNIQYRAVLSVLDKNAAELEKKLNAIRDLASTKNLGPRVTTAPVVKATGDPGVKGGKKGPTEEEIKKRATEVERIDNALREIEERIKEANKDLLGPQLEAVDLDMTKLRKDIKKLGGKEAVAFGARLNEGQFQAQQDVMRKFGEKLLAEQDAINKKLEDADAAAGRKEKESLEARLGAVTLTYAEVFRQIGELRTKLVKNGLSTEVADQMFERATSTVKEISRLTTNAFNGDDMRKQEEKLNDLLKERTERLKTIDALQDASLITSQKANEDRKRVIEEMQPKILLLAQGAAMFAAAMNGKIDQAQLDEFIAKFQLAVASAGALNKQFELTEKQVNGKLADGLTGVFDSAITAIAEATAGTKSWGQAFKDVGRSFLSFAASFLREIALMIAKALLLKAIESTSWGKGISALVQSVSTKHSGGLMNSKGNRRRDVSPALFANATRYHNGGMPGIASNEVPAILKKTEEVLTDDDPRHIRNIAKGGGGSGPARGQRIVLVDDRAKVHEAMNTAEGDEVIVKSVKRNVATLRSLLR